ncbi:MAG TPA: hypothetical protein V6C85_33010 [Allocoleopsis sp.]
MVRAGSKVDPPNSTGVASTSQDLVDDIQPSTGEPAQVTVENNLQQEFSSLGCDRTQNLPSQLASTPIPQSTTQQIATNQQKQSCTPTSLAALIKVQPQVQQASQSSFESEVTEGGTVQEEQSSSVYGQQSSQLDASATLPLLRSNTPASLPLSTPQPENALPLSSRSQLPSTPESETAPRDNSSGQSTPAEDPELGNLRLKASTEGADPELGNLRLRELPAPPPPSQPTVYLQGRFGYFRSNNLFSGVDPIDDGLFTTGLRLVAAPSLGPKTTLFAGVGGNLIRYGNESQYDYNELRFDAGVHQQIDRRTYGEVGWINRQLFDKKQGDRFLNDHSLYLALGRRDSLAKRLNLDTYYQFRLSFADPSNRSQAINYLGASLDYDISSSLQASLDYEFSIADFTQRDRLDQYHQLIGRITYTMSPNSQLYVFGGRSFGDSSASEIDFNGFVFGAGLNLNFALF